MEMTSALQIFCSWTDRQLLCTTT